MVSESKFDELYMAWLSIWFKSHSFEDKEFDDEFLEFYIYVSRASVLIEVTFSEVSFIFWINLIMLDRI